MSIRRHHREIGLDKLLKKLWQNELFQNLWQNEYDGINAIIYLFNQKYLKCFF